MREAVWDRYLTDPVLAQRLHGLIADHLETLSSDDPLRQTELMVHLVRSGDFLRTARHYAGLDTDSPGLRAATGLLAEQIALGAEARPNAALLWTVSLLQQPGLTPREVNWMCVNYQFYLLDALSSKTPLETRLELMQATMEVLKELLAADPGRAALYSSLASNHERAGNLLLELGETALAQRAYQNAADIRKGRCLLKSAAILGNIT
jgi:hypothetical protein